MLAGPLQRCLRGVGQHPEISVGEPTFSTPQAWGAKRPGTLGQMDLTPEGI